MNALPLLTLVVSASAALGEPGSPSLVPTVDSEPTPEGQGSVFQYNRGSWAGGFARIGDAVVFGASAPDWGRELFIAEGSPDRIRMLTECDPRPGLDTWPVNFSEGAGAAYFRGSPYDAPAGALYRTDGTAAGTRRVAFFPGLSEIDVDRRCPMVEIGGSLFFQFRSSPSSTELWRTDGDPSTQREISTVPPGRTSAVVRSPTRVGARVAFRGADEVVSDARTWYISDGERATTRPARVGGQTLRYVNFVSTIADAHASAPLADAALVIGGTTTTSTDQNQIYRLDGGEEAVPVTAFDPAANFRIKEILATAGGRAYFSTVGFASNRERELWASDGAPGQAVRVWAGDAAVTLMSRGAGVVFTVSTAAGLEFWSSDGSPASRFAGPFAAMSNPAMLAESGGLVFFTATEGGVAGLYRTDGTAAGTLRLGDAVPVADDGFTPTISPTFIGAFGGLLFTAASSHNTFDLWFSDGTPAGTRMLPSLCPSRVFGAELTRITALPGGRALVAAKNPGAGKPPFLADGDGSAPAVDADLAERLTVYGVLGSSDGLAFFFGRTLADGTELYATDGTPGGTRRLDLGAGAADGVAPADFSGTADNSLFAAQGGRAFFFRNGLKTADGSAVMPIANISPGAASTDPMYRTMLAADDGRVYTFGRLQGATQMSLIRTDGTGAGTAALATFPVGGTSTPFLRQAGGSLFYKANIASGRPGLYVLSLSDPGAPRLLLEGAARPISALGDGYVSVVDGLNGAPDRLIHTPLNGAPVELGAFAGVRSMGAELHGRSYFFASTETSVDELWSTDGTAGGTRQELELNAGKPGCVPQFLLAAGGRLVFGALSTDRTIEVWTSDGTAAGSRPAWRGDPQDAPRRVTGAVVSDGRLFFAADRAGLGVQLHAMLLCDADFNADAFIDSDDYGLFVGAFETGSPRADMNADGFVDFFDYSDYLAAFERGC